MSKILILHGPNLNLLGSREPEKYGCTPLETLNIELRAAATDLQLIATSFQSNAEHILIDRVHETKDDGTQFIIFNPAAFTHTSIALRDALLAVNKPFIEVHITNIHQRETYRQQSYFSDIALGVISGLGTEGYMLALRYAYYHLQNLQRSQEPLWTCEKSEN